MDKVKTVDLKDGSNYRNLKVWHKAFNLAVYTYKMSESFPNSELFGLTSQIRRSAISVPSNIAEGYMRNHKKEYVQFLSVALGSLAELQTQLLLSKELFPIEMEKLDFALADSEHLTAMLIKLIKSITGGGTCNLRPPSPVPRPSDKV